MPMTPLPSGQQGIEYSLTTNLPMTSGIDGKASLQCRRYPTTMTEAHIEDVEQSENTEDPLEEFGEWLEAQLEEVEGVFDL